MLGVRHEGVQYVLEWAPSAYLLVLGRLRDQPSTEAADADSVSALLRRTSAAVGPAPPATGPRGTARGVAAAAFNSSSASSGLSFSDFSSIGTPSTCHTPASVGSIDQGDSGVDGLTADDVALLMDLLSGRWPEKQQQAEQQLPPAPSKFPVAMAVAQPAPERLDDFSMLWGGPSAGLVTGPDYLDIPGIIAFEARKLTFCPYHDDAPSPHPSSRLRTQQHSDTS